jgi:hypothetical protein
MKQMLAIVRDPQNKEVSCLVLKVDTFLVPKQGRVTAAGREMAMESETVLTVMRTMPDGYAAIGTVDARSARLQVVNVGNVEDPSWATFQ